MIIPHRFPSWDELYQRDVIEQLPWYWPALDADFGAALAQHGLVSGRLLDLGTGPGTQAIALAERGFTVTGADVSAAAVAYATRKAAERGVGVTFVEDDVLASRLSAPFDAVFDRGCFHVLAPEQRARYVETVHRLLVPSGWLFLKTFSHRQPGDQGPHRFTPEDLRAPFEGGPHRFEVVEIRDDTIFEGQLQPRPRALFAAMRRVP